MTAPAFAPVDALRDAAPRVYWTDRPGAPQPSEPLVGGTTCDLLVIGGGFTGLWAAIEARRADPGLDVLVVDAQTVAFGASGRNGGFLSESLTHGIAHGVQLWPTQMSELLALGRQNVREIVEFTAQQGIDAGIRMCGKTAVATRPHELAGLAASRDLHLRFGETVELLDQGQVRADLDSRRTSGDFGTARAPDLSTPPHSRGGCSMWRAAGACGCTRARGCCGCAGQDQASRSPASAAASRPVVSCWRPTRTHPWCGVFAAACCRSTTTSW